MRSRLSILSLALVGAVVFLGCHTMRFVVDDAAPANTVRDRHHFFLWGTTPMIDVDVADHCPNGVVSLEEETTFVDGLFGLLTLGIYSPRSVSYHCASGVGT